MIGYGNIFWTSSKTLNNRARLIMFEIGSGPGCGVGDPGGDFSGSGGGLGARLA